MNLKSVCRVHGTALSWVLSFSLFGAAGCKPRTFNSSSARSVVDAGSSELKSGHPGPKDSEWKRTSVRDPKQADVDQDYLDNLHAGVHQAFAPWYHRKDSRPFLEMLRTQHSFSITGSAEGGTVKYIGNPIESEQGRYDFEKRAARMMPGQFRHEFTPADKALERRPILELTLKEFGDEPSKRLVEAYPNLTATPVPPIRDRAAHNDCKKFSNTAYSDEIAPEICKVNGRLYHFYLLSTHQKPVLDGFAQAMEAVRDHNGSDAELFKRLAHFIQVGSLVHPFYRANFSIIMSNVNYVLVEKGHRGVNHGVLDLLALFLTPEQFALEFAEHVARNQKK